MNATSQFIQADLEEPQRHYGADEKLAVMGQLASGMVHDFNNMLGIIKGNAALAMADIMPGAPGFDELHEISCAVNRAQDIARHILAFGRGLGFSLVPVPANNIILDSFNLLKTSVPDNVHFKLSLSPEPLVVNADQCLIEQVIVNLCKNALHAMPDGGSLTIKSQIIKSGKRLFKSSENTSGKFAVIKVFDTGRGIPGDVLNKIFDPFFSTKPRDQGTGLGLFISKFIVQNHGGRIHVNSIPGNGTIFSIYLPLV